VGLLGHGPPSRYNPLRLSNATRRPTGPSHRLSGSTATTALHPQLQPILELLEDTPNLEDVGVADARELFGATATFTQHHEVHDEYDTTVGGADGELDARVYRPGEGDRPVLVYFHGGGFVVGSLDTHDNVCQRLADESGWTVVSVDYRLAPEHPFPAPLEDADAAVRSVAADPDAVDGNGTVAVGGDSAGAALSAAVSLLNRDRDRDATTDETGVDIAHQVLFYPVCGSPFEEYPSREANAEGYFLERDTMLWFDAQYVQSPVHHRNEYLAPLLCEDLSGPSSPRASTRCVTRVRPTPRRWRPTASTSPTPPTTR